jgi:hypothetical protein
LKGSDCINWHRGDWVIFDSEIHSTDVRIAWVSYSGANYCTEVSDGTECSAGTNFLVSSSNNTPTYNPKGCYYATAYNAFAVYDSRDDNNSCSRY